MDKNKNVRKLTRQGKRSIGVILPIEMVKELKWKEKQRVKVTRIKGGMVIRDYRSKK
jgi:antitoxin component of MazEF toxin-antitoxin module